jgi:Coenzyme PQQ synthesis protein D (PqqD)
MFEMSGDRAVLLDASGSELITLNAVGSIVWNAMDTPIDMATLAAKLGETFPDVPLDQLRADVEEFVGQLRSAGLVVVDDADR